MSFYDKEIDEVLNSLKTKKEGLSAEKVLKRREEYGYNELLSKKKRSLFSIFIGQFKEFLVILLVAAMVISIILGLTGAEAGGATDAIIIGAILFINAGIGTFLEAKSEKSLEALMELSAPTATVRRNSKEYEVPARELVPGDILVLETGDKIPADVRLMSAINMKVY